MDARRPVDHPEVIEGQAVFIVRPEYPAVSPPVMREMQVPYLSHIELPECGQAQFARSTQFSLEWKLTSYVLVQYLDNGKPLYVPDDVIVRKAYQTMIVTREYYQHEDRRRDLIAELREHVERIILHDYKGLPVLVIEDTVRFDPETVSRYQNEMTSTLSYSRLIAVDKLTRVKARLIG